MSWLKKNKINYVHQKRYDDCRNTNPLPFDFYIKKYNILIEVDGEGHFYSRFHRGSSEEISEYRFNCLKENEKIKNNYCADNNIKLIRIPYYQFKNKEYIKILKNNLLK